MKIFYFHIIQYKIKILLSKISDLGFTDLLKETGVFCIYAGFSIGAYYFTLSMLEYLIVKTHLGIFLLHQFISMVLFIGFITISAGNIIVAYSTLYKSDEVKFLFSKPVKPSDIFLLKFFDNFFYSSSTLILVILSVFSAYCVFFEIPFLKSAYIIIFNIIPFLFSAGAAGVIILMILIKLSSKIGFRNLVYIISAIYISVTFLFFRIVSPVGLINEVMKYYPDLDRYLGFLLPDFYKYLPNNWISEVLYWNLRGNFKTTLIYTVLVNVFLIILSAIAVYLGKRWYRKTWLSGIGTKRQKRELITIPRFSFGDSSVLKPLKESILKKELFTFIREPSQVIHFLVLAMLILIFIISLNGINLSDTYSDQLKAMLFLSMYLFDLLIISTLSLRFVFPIISLEGTEFWRIKSAPIRIDHYLRKKSNPYFYLILSFSVALSYFPSANINTLFAIMMSVITIFSATSIFYLNFAMGSIFANFYEKNPIRIASSQGASLSFLFSSIYMIFIVSLLFFPLQNFFEYFSIQKNYNFNYFFVPFLFIAISTLCLILLSNYIIKSKALKY